MSAISPPGKRDSKKYDPFSTLIYQALFHRNHTYYSAGDELFSRSVSI